MIKHAALSSFVLALVFFICAACSGAQIDMKWDFVIPHDTMGWTANSDVADFGEKAGELRGKVKGSDPSLVSPAIKLTPTNDQLILIAMSSDKDGTAQFHWANTTEEPYGGFRPEKVIDFKVKAGNYHNIYQLTPFWAKEGQIIKIRIDPPADSTFKIDYIRIIRLPSSFGSHKPNWNFASDHPMWTPVRGITDSDIEGTDWVVQNEPDSLILSPEMNLNAPSYKWAMVQMLVSAGTTGQLIYVTDQETGAKSISFPIIPDGQMHTYNIDLTRTNKWQGSVIRVGIVPSDQKAEVKLKQLTIGAVRMGPAEILVKSLNTADAVNRTGHPTKLTAILLNNGGTSAKDIKVKLKLPGNVELKAGELTKEIPELASGKETTLEWSISGKSSGESKVELEVTAPDTPKTTKTAQIKWSEAAKK